MSDGRDVFVSNNIELSRFICVSDGDAGGLEIAPWHLFEVRNQIMRVKPPVKLFHSVIPLDLEVVAGRCLVWT